MTAGAVNEPVVSDTRALDLIHALMSGQQWDSTTIERVAQVIEMTGRPIEAPDNTDE